MKILLYFENEELIKMSGVGRAFEHQKRALTSAGIEYTIDPWDTTYDILHINTYGTNSDLIIRNARKMGKPVIYHAHSTEEDFRNSYIFSNLIAPIVKEWLVNLYTKADVLITPTPYSKKILEGYGIKLPIYAVSNGVDLDRFARNEEKVKAFRRYFGLKEDDKVIIGVGLLFQRKGLPDFVEVAKRLPDYKFIWFGDTNKMVIPHEISYIVENHPDNVQFPGYVKGPIIEGAYSDALCFFFPSYEETEGIVVLEALGSRCETVVRDIGAFDPWLKDGVNCYKGTNNDDFVRIIQGIAEGTLADTTEGGYKTAEERSIERVGQQLRQIYTSLLEAKAEQPEE